MRDALFIDEGNKDYVIKDGKQLVNFEKIRMKAALIREIRQFQSQEYPFKPNMPVHNFLYNLTTLDESSLYKLSCNLEPRTREL